MADDRPQLPEIARRVVGILDLVEQVNEKVSGTGGHGERVAALDAHAVAVDRRIDALEAANREQVGITGRLVGLAELAFADAFVRRALVTIALVLVLGGGGVTAVLAYLSPIGAPHALSTP